MPKPFDLSLLNLEVRDLRVYQALWRQAGPQSIRAIAEAVSLNQGTTFTVIKKLQKAGLVSAQYRLKRKYYAAEDPQKLESYALERQLALAAEMEKIKIYGADLKNQSKITAHQFTKFYDGEEEVAALLMDVLDTVSQMPKKQYQVYSSAEIRNHLYAKFRNFTRRRVQLGIEVQVLAVGRPGRKAKFADRHLLMNVQADAPAAYIIIYGDKVAQISLPETGYIQAVVVQDAAIAALQRIMFNQMWRRSKPLDVRQI